MILPGDLSSRRFPASLARSMSKDFPAGRESLQTFGRAQPSSTVRALDCRKSTPSPAGRSGPCLLSGSPTYLGPDRRRSAISTCLTTYCLAKTGTGRDDFELNEQFSKKESDPTCKRHWPSSPLPRRLVSQPAVTAILSAVSRAQPSVPSHRKPPAARPSRAPQSAARPAFSATTSRPSSAGAKPQLNTKIAKAIRASRPGGLVRFSEGTCSRKS